MAKKFFYVCAGLCLLVLSYQLGATTVGAQGTGSSVVAVHQGLTNYGGSFAVFTASGDVYVSSNGYLDGTYVLRGNVFSGPAVPVTQSSWGALKVKAR